MLSKNIDAAAQDVQAAINRATPNLPDDLPNNPTYKKTNPHSLSHPLLRHQIGYDDFREPV